MTDNNARLMAETDFQLPQSGTKTYEYINLFLESTSTKRGANAFLRSEDGAVVLRT